MARVLVLTLVFPPDGVSTAQIVGDLAADLSARGHDVTVLTTTPHYNRDEVAERDQPLERCWGRLLQRSRFRGVPVYHVLVPQKGSSIVLRLFAWGLFHLVSTLAALRYPARADVVFTPSPPLTMGVNAWVIGRLKGCPFIYNVQEIYPDLAISLGALRNRTAIRLAYRLERFVYRRAARITVIAPRMRQRLIEKGVPGARLEVIPNSVDPGDMRIEPRDNAFAREHGLLGRFVVSYAGNLGPAQGLETVLDAATLLRSMEGLLIVFIGGGMLHDSLRAAIGERRLSNVRMLPHQPYALVPQIYAASDLCLVTQAAGTGSDAIPSKVYRIMACGRPIMATTDPGSDLARVIQDAGCGEVVKSGDAVMLASRIRHAFDHPAEWAALGAAGRAHVERHYSRATTSARYDELIRRVAASR